MPACTVCGKPVGVFSSDKRGRCADCAANEAYSEQADKRAKFLSEREKRIARVFAEEFGRDHLADFEGMPVLTTDRIPGLDSIIALGAVHSEVSLGISAVKDFAIAVRDAIGGRSAVLESQVFEARELALMQLRRDAHAMGAIAVVGMRLTISEFPGYTGGAMILVCAYGTAVAARG